MSEKAKEDEAGEGVRESDRELHKALGREDHVAISCYYTPGGPGPISQPSSLPTPCRLPPFVRAPYLYLIRRAAKDTAC